MMQIDRMLIQLFSITFIISRRKRSVLSAELNIVYKDQEKWQNCLTLTIIIIAGEAQM
jgi:hypothetical protein